MKRRSFGQSLTEYMVLMVVVMAAFLAVAVYIKRGIQGQWKLHTDDVSLGEQYDPRTAHSHTVQSLDSNTVTIIETVDVGGRFETQRRDYTNSVEGTTGNIESGGY